MPTIDSLPAGTPSSTDRLALFQTNADGSATLRRVTIAQLPTGGGGSIAGQTIAADFGVITTVGTVSAVGASILQAETTANTAAANANLALTIANAASAAAASALASGAGGLSANTLSFESGQPWTIENGTTLTVN